MLDVEHREPLDPPTRLMQLSQLSIDQTLDDSSDFLEFSTGSSS
jgi:hypothetical protein